MARTALVIALLVSAFSVAFAPAALLRQVIPADGNVALAAPAGTLWDGSADLLLGGRSAGKVSWQLTPVTMLHGALGYHLELSGPDRALAAQVALRPGTFEVTLEGTAGAAWVNGWITRYDILLSGDFVFESIRLEAPYAFDRAAGPVPAAGVTAGRLIWSGGPVNYRLSGQDFAGTLPPLEARFGDSLETVVFATGNPTPLLRAQLLENGFARVGMTRLLPKLLSNPWPGAGPDHEVVLEVEEQVL